MKRKPRGFVATCQCGLVVGAMDAERTPRADAGKLLGKWLADGCTVAPRFDGTWSVHVRLCKCDADSPPAAETSAEYQGRRCMCIGSGCRAGPGCPHYTKDCQKHINHQAEEAAQRAQAQKGQA